MLNKIQSILKEFPQERMKSPNDELYFNCTVSRGKCFLVDGRRKISKYQKALGSRSEQLLLHTLQTFLKSSGAGFVEKVTKELISAVGMWKRKVEATNFLGSGSWKR